MKSAEEKKIAELVYTSLAHSKTPEHDKHIIKSLVSVLARKRMLSKSRGILDSLEALLDEKHGKIKAHVSVQERMSMKQKHALIESLKKKYKAKEVQLIEQVDQRLLGGIKIRVGEEVYDASIKSKLGELQKRLKV